MIMRPGVVLGGDNVLTFRGALVQNGVRISMAMLATRFNQDPTWDSVWGVNTAFYSMRFEGELIGDDIIVGKITREDVGRTRCGNDASRTCSVTSSRAAISRG